MTRIKGSKDKAKRKTKVFLTSQQEQSIVEDYNSGVSSAQIRKKYGISHANLSTIRKARGVKPRIIQNDIKEWENVDDYKRVKEDSGIYAIYFCWNYNNDDPERHNKVNDIQVYVGSSVDIGVRLRDHEKDLRKNQHHNKALQEKYNNDEYSMKYAIIERCSTEEIMQKEGLYLNRWNSYSLFNCWKPPNQTELLPWLEKASKAISYTENYTWSKDKFYNGTPCKESNHTHKSGYGTMQATIDGKTKYFTKHRIAYWEEHGEYPELVRHLCHNPKCCNPKHLAKGNHRDNALDNRRSFPQEFEEIWLKYQADLYEISKYYEAKGRWKPNQDWYGKKVSYSVYRWEKVLGLKEKYPDLVKNRISMLRSEHAAKGHETRKRNLNAIRKV